jgi:hypothetical protein
LLNFYTHSKSAPFHAIIHSPHLTPFHISVQSSHYFSVGARAKVKDFTVSLQSNFFRLKSAFCLEERCNGRGFVLLGYTVVSNEHMSAVARQLRDRQFRDRLKNITKSPSNAQA